MRRGGGRRRRDIRDLHGRRSCVHPVACFGGTFGRTGSVSRSAPQKRRRRGLSGPTRQLARHLVLCRRRNGRYFRGARYDGLSRIDIELPPTPFYGRRAACGRCSMEETRSVKPPQSPIEELAPQTYCQRAALELAALIRHQQKPKGGIRRDSALLRRCVEQVLGNSSAAGTPEGPWRTGTRPLKRPGRGGLSYIPLVTRGTTTVMVSTPTEAEELAAFLNYCGIQDLSS